MVASAQHPPVGSTNMTRWIFADYIDGWLGVRIEPENQRRANAIKSLIPREERMYIAARRTWVVKPKYGPTLAGILAQFCPGFTLMVPPGQSDMIRSLLYGPTKNEEGDLHLPGKGEAEIIGLVPGNFQMPLMGSIQEELNRRFSLALRSWNSNPLIRDSSATIGMSAREYCSRMVSRMAPPLSYSLDSTVMAMIDQDLAWDYALHENNGSEL